MTKTILDYSYEYVSSLIPEGVVLQIGALPIKDGVSIAISAGGIEEEFVAKDKIYSTTFTLNSKHTQQETALSILDNIHKAFGKNAEYFDNNELHFIVLRSLSLPTYLGRENDERYLYGSSFQIIWYLK